MFMQQFFIKGLAHLSYLVGGKSTCAIVDPSRDIQIYLDAADKMSLTITHILQTHLHADFVSGHMDLAAKTGARIYVPKSAKCRFPHVAVSEGDAFDIEDMTFHVLETPGHTPEHISYVVTDYSRGSDPVAVFTGDTLFVGDVGRPDLFPGIAQKLASRLFHSLHDKILKLPPFCEVYTAHGAGSLCGRAMGAKRITTIGYEKKYNKALQIRKEKAFIESLTTNMPAAPDHFSRCSAINRDGPARVSKMPRIAAMDPETFHKAASRKNSIILDIRPYESFGGMHVPGSFHIDFGGNFSTFAGWILPPDRSILLVVESAAQADEAAVLLRRVGLDTIPGFLEGGMFAWAKAGLPVAHVCQVAAPELNKMLRKGAAVTILDVRAPGEYKFFHIEGAVNIPVHDLRMRHGEINKDAPVVVTCASGHRSSLAASLLLQRGFQNVWNLSGGMTGFAAAGFAPVCPMCVAPHGPGAPEKGK